MTQEPPTKGTGTDVFFIKYRKLIRILSVFLLLYSPFVIYQAPAFSSAHKFQAIGAWINDLVFNVVVPIYLLIYTRKVYKAYNEELAEQQG